jgi:basic amino acid/polyamine antiporter, APA family
MKLADRQLVRAIGVPALTANIINCTIGAGIFVLPALIAKNLGAAAPAAFFVCAAAMALFVTCFAIAGSRVSLSGGLYAYVEVAFGGYAGFLAGVLYFLTAVSSVAGVVNVFVNSVAGLVPVLGIPAMRVVVIALVYAVLVAINVRGVREGAGAVTAITLVKLLPILLFLCAGVFFIRPANVTWPAWPRSEALGGSVVVLMFAFVGIESALIPSGEVKDRVRHERHVEFAAHDLRIRPRRCVAGVVRAYSSALSFARRRHRHLRWGRFSLVRYKHVRETGGAG